MTTEQNRIETMEYIVHDFQLESGFRQKRIQLERETMAYSPWFLARI